MGLEDIAMFRSIFNSTVLYPSDGVSTKKLIEKMAKNNGIVYLRTTRMDTPVIYDEKEKFEIGGSKVLRESKKDKITLIGAGITLHEVLKAHDDLQKREISTRVIDLYSIKPIDCATLEKAGDKTGLILVVEDHYKEGGIFEAVSSCLINSKSQVYGLSVSRMPRSGKSEELLSYEEIDSAAIVNKALELLR
jgi:transketolase